MYQPSKEQFEQLRTQLPDRESESYAVLCKMFTAQRPRVAMREWGGFAYEFPMGEMEGHLPGGIAHITIKNEWGN